MDDRWKYYDGKNVFIKLKNGRQYSGKVIDVDFSDPLIWITIIDKYDKRVMFSSGEIASIEEERR